MSKPSQPTTAASTPKTAIKVGDVCYDINVSKIPYLSSFVDFQVNAQPQSTEFVHEPIPLFDIALKGIESGYRQCFRSLPADLSQHHILCDTYHFLHVDVLGGQSIGEIINDLKSGAGDYDREERREIKGDRSKARDTAFKLLYLILLGDFTDEAKDSTKIFNAVLYLVSHAATFKWRTRSVVRAAYEERFVVSIKQKAALDKWEKKDPAKLAVEDAGDVTTEEEEPDYFDSDYSI
ncbi:hypothetical protein BJ875DRAFT_35711 [Amylocarpus encephaloides]|uniref:Uncharacterized protein n=1 Tax=Amylocarpus encephaloides TaxID=45428 RepID=A0A9P7Y7F8_9HELO|nr:hypothetical protein BJ875DRAFT_35711 [Amylocarpus encephaloides]